MYDSVDTCAPLRCPWIRTPRPCAFRASACAPRRGPHTRGVGHVAPICAFSLGEQACGIPTPWRPALETHRRLVGTVAALRAETPPPSLTARVTYAAATCCDGLARSRSALRRGSTCATRSRCACATRGVGSGRGAGSRASAPPPSPPPPPPAPPRPLCAAHLADQLSGQRLIAPLAAQGALVDALMALDAEPTVKRDDDAGAAMFLSGRIATADVSAAARRVALCAVPPASSQQRPCFRDVAEHTGSGRGGATRWCVALPPLRRARAACRGALPYAEPERAVAEWCGERCRVSSDARATAQIKATRYSARCQGCAHCCTRRCGRCISSGACVRATPCCGPVAPCRHRSLFTPGRGAGARRVCFAGYALTVTRRGDHSDEPGDRRIAHTCAHAAWTRGRGFHEMAGYLLARRPEDPVALLATMMGKAVRPPPVKGHARARQPIVVHAVFTRVPYSSTWNHKPRHILEGRAQSQRRTPRTDTRGAG